MEVLIQNGTVVDPLTSTIKPLDVYIKDGVIEQIGVHFLPENMDHVKIIDANGCYVMPGFIDLHVHLRDPGLTYKEDIESGCKAAAHGGVTTIVAMPNTKPVVDSPEGLKEVYEKAKQTGIVHVLQTSAVTKGQEGHELVDFAAMKKAGAIAFSEDGKSVMDVCAYQDALKKMAEVGLPMLAHCEEKQLVGKGVLNEGVASERFEVPGISNAVEDIITARDIFLAKETGAKLHLCHCSTKASVALVKMAKELGIPVTAEVCPHHFILTDADIVEDDSNYKMNPPLRKEEDVKALIEGLRDGIMEVISTDHAPHSQEEKAQDFAHAPFGIVGLETSAALTYTALVDTDILTPVQMAEKMSLNPAKILGIDEKKGSITEGKDADVVIFDPNESYVVDPKEFFSKGTNTPFANKLVKGRVKYTLVDGQVVYAYQQ